MRSRHNLESVALGALLAVACTSCVSAQPADDRAARPTHPQVEYLPDGVKAIRDIEYARPDGKPIRLDLYVPEKAEGPLPLIIWVHGGGWMSGDKADCPALPMTRRGYAVASINYRLSQRATWPAQIHDCKDMTVRFNQSEVLTEALKKAGVWVKLVPVPGAGHGFDGPEITKTVNAFFDEQLKGRR